MSAPGTGKTTTLVALLMALTHRGKRGCRDAPDGEEAASGDGRADEKEKEGEDRKDAHLSLSQHKSLFWERKVVKEQGA